MELVEGISITRMQMDTMVLHLEMKIPEEIDYLQNNLLQYRPK